MKAGEAVITGLGVVAPVGVGAQAYWAATLAGRTGLADLDWAGAREVAAVGGTVADLDPVELLGERVVRQSDRWTHLGLAASDLAIADAALDLSATAAADKAAVTASVSAAMTLDEEVFAAAGAPGGRHMTVYHAVASFHAALLGRMAIRYDLRGHSGNLVAGQAGGLDALAEARHRIAEGMRVVISGGAEAPLGRYAYLAALRAGALAGGRTRRAYAPFSTEADGYLPGEGATMIVLESGDHARDRNAPNRYGTIAGHASTFDPMPGSGRPPTLRRAIENALAGAGCSARDIDVVFADAAGDKTADELEVTALREVFGSRGVPVTAPKVATGRLGSGGAVLDVVCALLAMRHNVIPPTPIPAHAAPSDDVDLVRSPRPAAVRTALVVARGRGGYNSALVLKDR